MSTLRQYIQHQRKETIATIDAHFNDLKQQSFDHAGYMQDMLSLLHTYAVTGGKFGRPMLARLAYELVSLQAPTVAVFSASAVIELFHRYILIHDDIIDGDLLRHGIDTIEAHYRNQISTRQDLHANPLWYGNAMAIVAGDVLHTITNQLLSKSNLQPRIYQQFFDGMQQCFLETAAGWKLETELKIRPLSHIATKDITQAMELVSAAYSVIWPLKFGLILADKDMTAHEHGLLRYGYHTGMAFQIRDDILAIFGESERTGKPVGNDIREGKKSLLLHSTYQLASSTEKAWLEKQMYRFPSPKSLDSIQHMMQETGALLKIEEELQHHVDLSIQSLDEYPDSIAKQRLIDLAQFLAKRDY